MEPMETYLLLAALQVHPRLTAQAALVEQKIALAATAQAKAQQGVAAVETIGAYLQTASQAQAALQVSSRLAASRQPTALPSRLLLALEGQAQVTHRETAVTALAGVSVCRGTATLQSSQALQHRW